MPARTIMVQLESKVELNDILDVVLTPIEISEDGVYVREFRFFGTSNVPGASVNPLVMTVRCLADDRSSLEVTTPSLQV